MNLADRGSASDQGLAMNKERFDELQNTPGAELTSAEVAEGWLFCHCEWDGLLCHKDDPEGQLCGCYWGQA